jgi:hypothetical protein
MTGPLVVEIVFRRDPKRLNFDEVISAELNVHRIVIDPLGAPNLADRLPAMKDHVAHWADHVCGLSPGPFVIMAYCAGVQLGILLADHLATTGRPARSVVFDPVPFTDPTGTLVLDNLLQRIDASLVVPDTAPVGTLTADDAFVHNSRRLRTALDALHPTVSKHIIEDLGRLQRAWLSFSMMSAIDNALAASARRSRVDAVVSNEGNWPNWWTKDATLHRVDAQRADLCSSPSVRALVTSVLQELKPDPT